MCSTERLAEWIKQRQARFLEERKASQKNAVLDLAAIELREKAGIKDEDVEDDDEDGVPQTVTYT